MTEQSGPEAYPPAPQVPSYGGYGAPMPPDQSGPAAPSGPLPSSVANATRLMIVSAALGVIGIVILVATKSRLRTAIAKKDPSFDAQKPTTAVNAAVVIGAVFGVIFIVLFVVLALQVRKGKNWARIVTWVITGLGVLSALGSSAQAAAAISRIATVIGGVLDVAIIVLLVQRSSNAYFRKRV
jgi:hypothetical protein